MRSIATLVLLMIGSIAVAEKPTLVIHEWGTFTSLQNAKGEAIGWINTDDEPVPQFVHTLDGSAVYGSPSSAERRLTSPTSIASTQPFTKGLGALHPDATMRLETPVVYFYDRRPMGGEGTMKVDVSVEFRGGFLTQFYPNAASSIPKIIDADERWVRISSETRHELTWSGLEVGGADGTGPATDSKIWLAPRQVKANSVRTAGGESEKYVFYRGVGHLDSPLRVSAAGSTRPDGRHAFLTGHPGGPQLDPSTTINKLWLAQISPSGEVAMRPLRPVNLIASQLGKIGSESLTFKSSDFSIDNLKALRKSMREALVGEGLFEDEAEAMLNTWEASYFKSPGLRVFYVVPPAWTEIVLPMKVSVPAKITRVMIGRIELVTPEQEALLVNLKEGDVNSLGRFRGALMNDAMKRNPSPKMDGLLKTFFLEPAKIAR